ncbi:MAG: GTP pyrophosphokinase [Candidatus Hydrogenedentota bacterium]|nr:MAG: GTP pyrophosphokinase [Candidatus Hydrogenedentota bacterium]PCJ62002.1 MAG: GTP pyrophosphokinase [Candidatus Hydrogenedentota bacterium]
MFTIEDAIIIATEAHRGMVDKGGQSYILHPLRVMHNVNSDEERMAALLHDVVEDTEWTLDKLRERGLPETVVEAVDCLTRRSEETYEEFVIRCKPNAIARQVKLADIEDNMDINRLDEIQPSDIERLSRYKNARHALLS